MTGFTSFLAAAEKEEAANALAFTDAISAHLGGRAVIGGPMTGGTTTNNTEVGQVWFFVGISYIYIYIHTHTPTHVHIYIHKYVYLYVSV